MAKLKLLDLFCSAGGAGYGYHLAGFEVTGVDIAKQPRYPFEFIQGDAIEYVLAHGHEYDAIHASPPCQRYSILTPPDKKQGHADLISPVRQALRQVGKPSVIENVPGARKELINPILLCGSMFGLPIERHRYFELSWADILMLPLCAHLQNPVLISGVTTKLGANGKRNESVKAVKNAAIGIDWMIVKELDEAIPPAFTKFIGEQLLTLF